MLCNDFVFVTWDELLADTSLCRVVLVSTVTFNVVIVSNDDNDGDKIRTATTKMTQHATSTCFRSLGCWAPFIYIQWNTLMPNFDHYL